MALSIGKRDVERMADLLDREWEDRDDLAKAALQLGFEICLAKSKYIVVGQLKDGDKAVSGPVTLDKSGRKPEDPTKFALGPYGTYTQAHDAAVMNDTVARETNASLRTWPVALTQDTLWNYFKKRQKELEKLEEKPLVAADRLALINGWLTPEQLGISEGDKRHEDCWFCGQELPDPNVYDIPSE